MWRWLKENHPVFFEVVSWVVLGIAVIALIKT